MRPPGAGQTGKEMVEGDHSSTMENMKSDEKGGYKTTTPPTSNSEPSSASDAGGGGVVEDEGELSPLVFPTDKLAPAAAGGLAQPGNLKQVPLTPPALASSAWQASPRRRMWP